VAALLVSATPATRAYGTPLWWTPLACLLFLSVRRVRARALRPSGWPAASTYRTSLPGDLLRANLADETPLGVEAKGHMDAADLVPDSVTVAMVRDRLTHDDAVKGFILDGFPRTLSQAGLLAEILEERGEVLDAVVEFQVAAEELVMRLRGRGRADDIEEIIRRRQESTATRPRRCWTTTPTASWSSTPSARSGKSQDLVADALRTRWHAATTSGRMGVSRLIESAGEAFG
jgi:Adenylate kinase